MNKYLDLKTINQNLLAAQIVLHEDGEYHRISEFIDATRMDWLMKLKQDGVITSLDEYQFTYVADLHALDKSEKKKVINKSIDYVNAKMDNYNQSFYVPQVYYMKKNNQVKVDYSLKDKIGYYRNRINDSKLSYGQRQYALQFLNANGVKV